MKSKVIGLTGSSGVLGKEISKNFKNFKILKYKGDIRNKTKLFKWLSQNNFDGIIHLAAVVATSDVSKDKKYAKDVNYYSTKNLVDFIIKLKKKDIWLFFASTSHVYGFSKKKIKENTKCNPQNYYGYTKYLAERYLLKKKINVCIGRIFSYSSNSQKQSFFIPSIINKLRSSKNNIIKVENVDHYRDFLTTKEIVNAIKILFKNKSNGIWNICSSKKVKLIDIIKEINKFYKKNIKIIKGNRQTTLIGNNNKIKKLGWKISNKSYLSKIKKIFSL